MLDHKTCCLRHHTKFVDRRVNRYTVCVLTVDRGVRIDDTNANQYLLHSQETGWGKTIWEIFYLFKQYIVVPFGRYAQFTVVNSIQPFLAVDSNEPPFCKKLF